MPETVFCYDDYFSRYGKFNIFLLSPPPGICLTILSFLSQSLWLIFFSFILGRLIISKNRKLDVVKNRMVLEI